MQGLSCCMPWQRGTRLYIANYLLSCVLTSALTIYMYCTAHLKSAHYHDGSTDRQSTNRQSVRVSEARYHCTTSHHLLKNASFPLKLISVTCWRPPHSKTNNKPLSLFNSQDVFTISSCLVTRGAYRACMRSPQVTLRQNRNGIHAHLGYFTSCGYLLSRAWTSWWRLATCIKSVGA